MRHPFAVPVAVVTALTALAAGGRAQPATDYLAISAAGLKTLQDWYVPETGL
jgi:hypothetical protein